MVVFGVYFVVGGVWVLVFVVCLIVICVCIRIVLLVCSLRAFCCLRIDCLFGCFVVLIVLVCQFCFDCLWYLCIVMLRVGVLYFV